MGNVLSTSTPGGIEALVKPADEGETPSPRKTDQGNKRWPAGTGHKQAIAEWEIVVDPEFRDRLPPLTGDEREALRELLVLHGCTDALKVWGGPEGNRECVDGHNRYDLCLELGIPVGIEELRFANRAEVLAWIDKHQRARRNLSDEAIAEMYRREIESRKNGAHTEPQGKAADVVAKKLGTSPATVKRAAKAERERAKVKEATGESCDNWSREEIAGVSTLSASEYQAALAGGRDSLREAGRKAATSKKAKKPEKDLKWEERGTMRVPFKKEHRCKASFRLIERADGRWFFIEETKNAVGGGGSSDPEVVLYDYPNGKKGKPRKGYADRETCLQAAAKKLEEFVRQTGKHKGAWVWPPPARKVLSDWRASLSQPPSKGKATPLITTNMVNLRIEAEKHIERYLDTIEPAAAAWQQSDFLLDALNRWRGRNKLKASRKKGGKR